MIFAAENKTKPRQVNAYSSVWGETHQGMEGPQRRRLDILEGMGQAIKGYASNRQKQVSVEGDKRRKQIVES